MIKEKKINRYIVSKLEYTPIIKAIYDKPITNITFDDGGLKVLPLR